MSLEIIIDGYNLLHASPNLSVRKEELLEKARNRMIEKLSYYRKMKKVSITVVFDGWKGGFQSQSQEMLKGIKVIYSKLGETADEVIKRMIDNASKEMLVVTSDREIRDFADQHSFISVSSSEFEKKMAMASHFEKEYDEDEENCSFSTNKPTTKKKGNPKRLSKAERKRRVKLKKL